MTLFIYHVALLLIIFPVWLYVRAVCLILIYVSNKQISVLLTEVPNALQFCTQKPEFIHNSATHQRASIKIKLFTPFFNFKSPNKQSREKKSKKFKGTLYVDLNLKM